MKYFLLIIPIVFFSCVDQNKKNDEKIKEVVVKFWTAVENNDSTAYENLIYNAEMYPGVVSSELFFLNNHKKLINPSQKILDKVIIKDTLVYASNTKEKYVQYTFEQKNDSSFYKRPLIVTLMFSELVGFDIIYHPGILDNHIGWDKKIK